MGTASIINEEEPLAPNDGNLEPTKLETSASTPAPAPAPAKDKPSKFAGKSVDDVAKMYEELEHRFGKQGEEVGELRKLSDQLIRSSLEKKEPAATQGTKQEPSTTADADAEFFINPRAAVKKLLEEDEVIRDLRQHKTETQQERALRVTMEKHPEANDIVADPEFEKWVKASKYRFDLFLKAQQFDADAADELFGTFKDLNKARLAQKTAAVEVDKSIVESQKKAAGAASGTTVTEDSTAGKPIFSRRKLMELRINNPEEYEARSDEILAAYAEGRVKR